MTIYIYSTQLEIGQIISDHLTSLGNLCFFFSTTQHLTASLANLKDYPDLLILDYTTFNHDLFNVREYFNDNKMELPIIFYNDPCITKTTRPKHWLSQIKLLQNISKVEDFTSYESVFNNLAELIEDKAISPYIKLMQHPLPIPDYLKKVTLNLSTIKNTFNDNLDIFIKNVNLPKNLIYLLKIFQKNQTFPLSLNEIQNIYKIDNKQITETSLKVLISKLRGEIEKDPSCQFRISNNRGLYSFLKISNI